MQKIMIGILAVIVIIGLFLLSKKNTIVEVKEKNIEINTSISDTKETSLPNKEEKMVLQKKWKTFTPNAEAIAQKTEEAFAKHIETIPENMTYDEFKIKESKNFQAMQSKMDDEIAKIPDCLAEASTKEEAFACNKKLLEIAKQMMPDGNLTAELENGYDENFTWSEEEKIKMIQEIDDNTPAMQDITSCVNMSKNSDEMEECLSLLNEKNKTI